MVALVANAERRTMTLTFEYNDPEMPQRREASGDMDTTKFLEFLNGLDDLFPAQSGLQSQYSETEPGYLLVRTLRVCGFKFDDLPLHWEEALLEMDEESVENERNGEIH